MELADAIRTRRSVHEYTNASVDRLMIQSLVDAAIQAPSAMNNQPWAFCAFVDRSRIDDLSNRVKEWLLNQTQQAPSELNQALTEILTDPGFRCSIMPQRSCSSWPNRQLPRQSRRVVLQQKTFCSPPGMWESRPVG